MGFFDSFSKKTLKYWDDFMDSSKNYNRSPSSNNSLIHKYPYNLTTKSGHTVSNIMQLFISVIKQRSGLKNIYGGYILVTPSILKDPEWNIPYYSAKGISTMGFERNSDVFTEKIEKEIKNNVYNCIAYIAIPIDDMDFSTENSAWTDWDIQERFVDPTLMVRTVPSGAITLPNIGKMRTLRYVFDLDGADKFMGRVTRGEI
jgi:hypothetical protein